MQQHYDVRDKPPRIPEEALARLRQVETATVGHFRLGGFMAPRLRSMLPGSRIAGTAVTVRTLDIDSTAILIAIDALRAGDLLVVDRGGEDRHACFGAVTSFAVRQSGAAGVVIDGRACDIADIRKQGMPLWCTGSSPVLGRRLDLGGGVNVPINCGGVVVAPGDAILADDGGILVADPAGLDAMIDEALERQRREVVIFERLAAGEKLSDIAGLPRFSDYRAPPLPPSTAA
jgi:regulator of RNase E activity RraA